LKRRSKNNIPFGVTFFENVIHVGEHVWKEYMQHSFNSPFLINNALNQLLYLLTPLDEVMGDPNVYLTGLNQHLRTGFVLLLLLTTSSFTKGEFITMSDVQDCRSTKPNIIKKQGIHHFNSRGEEFLYGIGARFSNAHGVTLGEYSSKIAGKEDKTRDKITSVLEDCIRSIERKDSQVIQFTTISLEVISKIISNMLDQNGNKVKTYMIKHKKILYE
jgi:hypothetical protein